MKAITYILQNTSAVTDLLTGGDGAIYIGHGKQGQESPYITLEVTTDDAYVAKETASTLMKESYEVTIYSKDFGTGETIAEKVIAALDNKAAGTYNTQEISSCKLHGRDRLNGVDANNEYWLNMLQFDVVVNQAITSYTAISAMTYTWNEQSTTGAITAMVASVTGDVNNYKVADSDETNYDASGLVLNTSTGTVTGTLAADADFEVLAIGQDGLTIGAENVTHTYSAGGVWEPNDLGSDLFHYFDITEDSSLTKTPSGNRVDRIADLKTASTDEILHEDIGDDDNASPLVIWPYDPTLKCLHRGRNSMELYADDIVEDYRIYMVGMPEPYDATLLGGSAFLGQSWRYLELNNGYRNYPYNQSINEQQMHDACNGAGVFIFDPYDSTDPRTTKNDGSKYTILHGSGNDNYEDSLQLSLGLTTGGLGLYWTSLLITKPLSVANEEKLLGWALHKFSLPLSEWDSGFTYYNSAP